MKHTETTVSMDLIGRKPVNSTSCDTPQRCKRVVADRATDLAGVLTARGTGPDLRGGSFDSIRTMNRIGRLYGLFAVYLLVGLP